MFLRFALLLCALCAAVPAQAQIRYDRMHMACNDKPATCRGLVVQIEKKLHFAKLVREGSGFSQLWVNTMLSVRQLIGKLKQDYPGVWEAQNCPMGECRMPWDNTVPAPAPDPRRFFDPSMRDI